MSTKLASTTPQDIKCVAVGDGAVGKTCMLISYAQNRFPEDYIPTVFDNYSAKLLHQGEYINLHLWDTAGQEAYQSLRHISYPGTDVFLVVFSVVSRNSFNNAINLWFEDIKETAPGIPIVFVGAKSDLRLDEEAQEKCRKMGKPMVTTAEATKAAKKLGAAAYVECSAITQDGIHDVFNTAVSVATGSDEKSEQQCACTIM